LFHEMSKWNFIYILLIFYSYFLLQRQKASNYYMHVYSTTNTADHFSI
jgi:hypothetical protein